MSGRFLVSAALIAVFFFILLPADPGRAAGAEFQLDLGTGYRSDDLDWNIAGEVNVLSELKWQDLEIFQVVLAGRLLVDPPQATPGPWKGYLRGSLGYGWITEGSVQDSDFAGDNRTGEFSRSVSRADDGNVLDTAIGAGIQLSLLEGAVSLAPLVGFSYHEQNLTLFDGIQVLSRPDLSPPGIFPPPTGPLPATLDTTYDAEWRSTWVGFDLEVEPPASRFGFFATLEYHWVIDYDAVADWNLRQDFAHPRSFTHRAEDGWGGTLAAGARLRLTPRLGLFVRADYQSWEVKNGTDRVFFASGNQSTTRLNEVNRESAAVTGGFEGRF